MSLSSTQKPSLCGSSTQQVSVIVVIDVVVTRLVTVTVLVTGKVTTEVMVSVMVAVTVFVRVVMVGPDEVEQVPPVQLFELPWEVPLR